MALITIILTLIAPIITPLINLHFIRKYLFTLKYHQHLVKIRNFDYVFNLVIYVIISSIAYFLFLKKISVDVQYILPIIGSIFVIINFLYKYKSDLKNQALDQFNSHLKSIESFISDNTEKIENTYLEIYSINLNKKSSKLTYQHSMKLALSSNFNENDNKQLTDENIRNFSEELQKKNHNPNNAAEKLLLAIFNNYILKSSGIDYLTMVDKQEYCRLPLLEKHEISLFHELGDLLKNQHNNQDLQLIYRNILSIIQSRIARKSFQKVQRDPFIIYQAYYRLIDDTLSKENYGVLFRLIHRNIKLINHLNLSVYEERMLIGRIRAIIPDKLIYILYYNCTYSKKGFGLGKLLVGSDFFGTKQEIREVSQHFKTSDLIYRKIDLDMLENFYGASVYPGDFPDIKKFNNIYLITYYSKIKKEITLKEITLFKIPW